MADMNVPMNLRLDQMAPWLDGAVVQGQGACVIDRVITDSRAAQAGDLFVALQGEHFDAHNFLPQVAASGATAALVQRGWAEADLPCVQVPDTRRALGQLAQGWRRQFELPVIAVTGSNGKTTVTQMVASILRAACGDDALATQGNLNNDIGVPQTLLRLRAHHRLAVVELGMNHPGEIAGLAAMTQPTVALVNNAQREHLEHMVSVDAVAQENGAVLQALPDHGVAVFPADDAYTPLWQSLAGQRTCWRFSMNEHASADAGSNAATAPTPEAAEEANLAEVRLQAAVWQQDHWLLSAHTPLGLLQTELHIAGRHNVSNALAATACALAAGVSLAHIAQGLQNFAPVKGRSRAWRLSYQGRALTVVDDSYNANPDSVRAALDVLAALPAPRLLVLGDMGEVGTQGPEFHQEVGRYAAQLGLAHVLCLGELSAHTVQAYAATVQAEGQQAQHCADMDALNHAVLQHLPRMGSVLVKGSRFMQMERVIEALQAVQDPSNPAAPNANSLNQDAPPCC